MALTDKAPAAAQQQAGVPGTSDDASRAGPGTWILQTVSSSSSVQQACFGHFSGADADEVVLSCGTGLELWGLSGAAHLGHVCSQSAFGMIRDMRRFPSVAGGQQDHLVRVRILRPGVALTGLVGGPATLAPCVLGWLCGIRRGHPTASLQGT